MTTSENYGKQAIVDPAIPTIEDFARRNDDIRFPRNTIDRRSTPQLEDRVDCRELRGANMRVQQVIKAYAEANIPHAMARWRAYVQQRYRTARTYEIDHSASFLFPRGARTVNAALTLRQTRLAEAWTRRSADGFGEDGVGEAMNGRVIGIWKAGCEWVRVPVPRRDGGLCK